MSFPAVPATIVALCATSPCFASFTGFTVEHRGNIGNRDVYQVFASFANPNNVLLNLINHTVTAGSMSSVLHSDSSGTWNPSQTFTAPQIANDSFATINGLTGALTSTGFAPVWSGIGAAVPNGQGWFNSNPSAPVIVGASGRVMIMQVAIASGASGYTAQLSVGFKVDSAQTQPTFGSGTFTIPAPGIMGFACCAGVLRTRRRLH
ncbi:MAG: hypothetical protein FGM37_01870 [Phycisphaerales bacterium]|nr:hypothetical protein [Phycisphaerales bacterium]